MLFVVIACGFIDFYAAGLAEYKINICGKLVEHTVYRKFFADKRIASVLVFLDLAVVGVSAVVCLQSFVSFALAAVCEVVFEEEVLSAVVLAEIVFGILAVLYFESVFILAVEPRGALVFGFYRL